MSYLTVSQFAGFAVTPGITFILYYIDFDLFAIDRMEVDMYSSAGYILVFASLAALVFVRLVFVEPPSVELEEEPVLELKETLPYSLKDRVHMWLASVPQKLKEFSENPHFYKILLFSLLVFVTRGSVAVLETVNTELTNEYFGWDSQRTGIVLCVLGIIGSSILFFLPKIAKKTGEGRLLLVGLGSLTLGLLLIMPWQRSATNEVQFLIGLGFTWSVGSALCQTLITSFLSRLLGPKLQAGIMGWMASLGSVARVFGALWAGFAIATPAGADLGVGLTAGLMVICLLCTVKLLTSRSIANV